MEAFNPSSGMEAERKPGESAYGARKHVPDDFELFVCGEADEATRERMGRELEDPESELNAYIHSLRTGMDRLQAWLAEGAGFSRRPDWDEDKSRQE
jgi:hypothetical protein